MDILVPGLWHTAQLAKEGCWSQGLLCAYTELSSPGCCAGDFRGSLSVCGEEQLLPGPARVSCGPGSCVASSQGISESSWAEQLTTYFFSCSQWLPKTIHSCDPVAAANLVMSRVLAHDKSGHFFAGNNLCNEGLRSFCHRTVPKDFQGELALHRAIQLERIEGQKSQFVQAMP